MFYQRCIFINFVLSNTVNRLLNPSFHTCVMFLCLICVHNLLSSSCHVVSLLSFLVFVFFFFLFIIIIIFIFYWLHVCAKEIIYLTPPLGGPHWNIAILLCYGKLELCLL